MATRSASNLTQYNAALAPEQQAPALPDLAAPFADQLAGGNGDDTLIATDQRSHLAGGAGNDLLQGGAAADWLVGGAGQDTLYGGGENDRLDGDAGDDRLTGGSGDDFLDGGAGWDVASYSGSVLDYSFSLVGNAGIAGNAGMITVVRDDRSDADGTDSVRKVEELQFADRTIYLDGRNNIPYAVADSLATDEDVPLQIAPAALLANDWDFEGQPLTLAGVSSPVNGTVTLGAGGDVVFTPAQHFSGTASFDYTVSDGHGGLDTGTVQIQVNAVADAPLLSVTQPEPPPGGAFAHTAQTNLVSETESNNTRATANVIGRDSFSIADNPILTDDADPSVSIAGVISSAFDRDHFQFSFKAGETVIFDIDYGKPDVDTVIVLYDAAGNMLAQNDDYGFAHQSMDGGSVSFLDSYLSYTFAQDGSYTLMVRPFSTGGDYRLNVSIDDATAQGGSVQPVPLDIQAALVDTDGSESLSIVISGLPAGASLSAGTHNADGSWTLVAEQLPGLMLTLPAGTNADGMVVDAIAIEGENGSTAHSIIGGAGDNLLRGGAESDILTGGDGADTFDFDTLSRQPDVITDFTTGPGGDVLDFSDLLQPAQAALPLDQLLATQETAAGTLVSVATADGVFHPVVLLQDVYGISGQELATAENLKLF